MKHFGLLCVTKSSHFSRYLMLLILLAVSISGFEARSDNDTVSVEEDVTSKLYNLVESSTPAGTATIEFEVQDARYVRLMIHKSRGGQPCLDELEIFEPDSSNNLALASDGAVAHASSAFDHPFHKVGHLNDGIYGNANSWIPETDSMEWAQIELPDIKRVSRVDYSRDRSGAYQDRIPVELEVLLSLDAQEWASVAHITHDNLTFDMASLQFPVSELSDKTWNAVVEYAFLRERDSWDNLNSTDYLSPLFMDRPATPDGELYWSNIARLDALARTLLQFEAMLERLTSRGVDTRLEFQELSDLKLQAAGNPIGQALDALYLKARHAKRQLFFRDPMLESLEEILFAKHHPLKPSHNYSDHFDALFAPGGGIYVLSIPRDTQGRLDPAQGTVRCLFDGSDGIVRHPVSNYDANTIYFAYRPNESEVPGWKPYWHLWEASTDGSTLRKLTEGPYHDFDPVVLPDGGLAFMSTRCEIRFLCWRPQAYVLHRMNRDGTDIQRLSYANLSEWHPSMMQDGRIMWTRSEYLDKGADFGHTLWSIRPDGTHPELVFGNNTPYGYNHGHQVPGTHEIVATLISHGDHQGPIVLIDTSRGPYDTGAITNITPDTAPQYQMDRVYTRTFRDPTPLSSDHFLVSHNPGMQDHWGLYIIDRYGNRELIYLDPEISSKRPSPLNSRKKPPTLTGMIDPELAKQGLGLFTILDVYEGLEPLIQRGKVKYLRVVQEVPSILETLECGQFQSDHEPFSDYYASPVHLVHGPAQRYLTQTQNALHPHAFRTGHSTQIDQDSIEVTELNGWPSYVAKAPLGIVPIEDDGSAHFLAPAGKVLYFQVLDEDYNEIQRMRSVVQLQFGERRSCVGCHDDRQAAPPARVGKAFASPPKHIEPAAWGAGPFDYERVVQPILDNHCIRCHDGQSEAEPDLRSIRDEHRVPASYRSLISGGYVHYFDWVYGARHFKAEPLGFGTLQSALFEILKTEAHQDVKLEPDELRAVKEWIDLNCPLWPDYQYRPNRPE